MPQAERQITQEIQDDESDESDSGQQTKAYCQGKWIFGITCVASASIIHVIVLPYLDLTLMACNASTAMIANLVLSRKYLGETFVWKYDCTALVLIAAGCTTIVLNAHTNPVHYEADEVASMLKSARVIIFFAVSFTIFFSMILLINHYLAKLRLFEQDVDYFDETRSKQSTNYKPILEPRLKSDSNILEEGGCCAAQEEPLIENLNEVQRPARALIDTIKEMTDEEIRQVSPNSLRLKRFVKVPLLLLLSAAGMMSGISISMLKFTTELVASGAFLDKIGLCFFLIAFAFIGGAS